MFSLASLALRAPLFVATATQGAPLPTSQEVSASAFTSAQVCGKCHQAIHAVWQQSLHANSFTNGVFQAGYRAARSKSADRARLCLNCHAPLVRHTRDYAAESALTREGVTCDFCHSIRSVALSETENTFDLHVGRTKYGPLRHAQSPAHEVIPTELHLHAEFCAPCHEYRNEHGVAVLETYSEWKRSPYAAEGTQCQNCHMPLVPGRTVSRELKSTLAQGVNLHDISGSHDVEHVRRAVTMEIEGAERLGPDRVEVRISVHNVGSGHCFPTGLPLHRAVLEVNLTDRGRVVAQRTVKFEKVLLNEQWVAISREYEAFFDARSVASDTRLQPKEKRMLTLSFRDLPAPEGRIEASLWYEYDTQSVIARDGTETIEPVNMKFLLAARQRNLPAAR